MATRQPRQAPLISLAALKGEASAQKLLNRLVEQGLEAQRATIPPANAEPGTQPDPKRSQAAVVELLQVFTRCCTAGLLACGTEWILQARCKSARWLHLTVGISCRHPCQHPGALAMAVPRHTACA